MKTENWRAALIQTFEPIAVDVVFRPVPGLHIIPGAKTWSLVRSIASMRVRQGRDPNKLPIFALTTKDTERLCISIAPEDSRETLLRTFEQTEAVGGTITISEQRGPGQYCVLGIKPTTNRYTAALLVEKTLLDARSSSSSFSADHAQRFAEELLIQRRLEFHWDERFDPDLLGNAFRVLRRQGLDVIFHDQPLLPETSG